MSVKLKRENDIIIYSIDEDANTYEVEMARKGFERKNQLLGLVRDCDDLFTCTYPVQKMYEVNQNDNNYTVAISKDITKIRTQEIIDDLIYEYITTIDFQSREYNVMKYVHALNHSTMEALSYSSVNGGDISYDDAKVIILSSLEKIKSLDVLDEYIDMSELELFFKDLNVQSKRHV